jgi:uncharacterized protein (DUF58 family)
MPATATLSSPTAAPGAAECLLRELEWTVIRKLDGLVHGDYRSLLHGSGSDLADLREYQPHDDVRHIDWNVTARMNSPHVRVFTEDRSLSAWFLLDLSPSIHFGPPGHSKHDLLQRFVAVLARLLTRHGNRVGALLYGGAPSAVNTDQPPHPRGAPGLHATLPARGGRSHVLHLLHRLQTASPAHPPKNAGKQKTQRSATTVTELHRLLQAAQAQLRRRSTVFVVSDFISAPGWDKPLAQLALRHDVVAVRLFDPLENQLPDVGLLTLRDAESGELLQLDTHDAAFRRRFAQLAEERETALRAALVRAGADTLELRTDDDLLDALLRFMDLRQRHNRSRGAALLAGADNTANRQATDTQLRRASAASTAPVLDTAPEEGPAIRSFFSFHRP